MSATPAVGSNEDLFEALENYDWDNDVEFQSGLSAILGSNSSPEQATELTLRARCFYYERKYNSRVDFDAYKAYRNSRPQTQAPNGVQAPPPTTNTEAAGGILPTPSSANEPPAPYPTSFAHIVELVTTGQPIPGIKQIPDTVLTGQGTESTKDKRRKPWEKDEATPADSGESAPASWQQTST